MDIPPVVPIAVAIVLIPQFEALESIMVTGKPPQKTPKEALQATPMMRLFCYSGVVINLWWMWVLPHKCSAYDTIYYLILAFFLADIASGIYHWFQDSYRSTNEKINQALFNNFQLHHESTRNPSCSTQNLPDRPGLVGPNNSWPKSRLEL